MTYHQCARRLAVGAAAAAAIVLAVLPVRSDPAEPDATPARYTSATAVALPVALPPAAMPASPRCHVALEQARLRHVLPRMTRRIVSGHPIKIVAIGSSSTSGAGASSPAASYPSQLAAELAKTFRGHDITVLNRGVNGEEAGDMLARFERDVIAEKPDLVLWQVGSNSVLRERPLDQRATVLHEGIAQLKAIRADIVLIDPQYVPKILARPGAEAMVTHIAAIAREQKVDLFRRFELMRRWHEVDGLTFDTIVSPDRLHLNDWSYACFAKWLARAITEASMRPIPTATAPRLEP
jgi:lysophospholipase L1-like esterase